VLVLVALDVLVLLFVVLLGGVVTAVGNASQINVSPESTTT
jgi:hypothetical protein